MDRQLEKLRERNPQQYDIVEKVIKSLSIFDLPANYQIDKPDVAFIFRFEKVCFHIVFNVVDDESPEETKTDKICYSIQDFDLHHRL